MAATATAPKLTVVDGRVECAICGHKSHSLLDHISEVHGMTPEAYLAAYPNAATVSKEALDLMDAKLGRRRRSAAPLVTELTIDMMGMTARVDHGITEDQCLPIPEGYKFPTTGAAYIAFRRALLALLRGRKVFIHGGPGCGKDALVHAFSHYTRTPALIYTFTPGTEIKRWFYSREIGADGTSWSTGALMDAIVNGVVGSDGVARPALILFSDVDRGTAEQLEEFRLTLDTTSMRIVGPTGDVHKIMEGTRFAFTANSCGTGDETGRFSSEAIDASLLDRMGRFIEFTHLDWTDESEILRSKFPALVEAAPSLIDDLGRATAALRAAIKNEEVFGEFTHRGLCEVLSECEDELSVSGGKVPHDLLRLGFRSWLDRLDGDNRMVAQRAIDPHIGGGAF